MNLLELNILYTAKYRVSVDEYGKKMNLATARICSWSDAPWWRRSKAAPNMTTSQRTNTQIASYNNRHIIYLPLKKEETQSRRTRQKPQRRATRTHWPLTRSSPQNKRKPKPTQQQAKMQRPRTRQYTAIMTYLKACDATANDGSVASRREMCGTTFFDLCFFVCVRTFIVAYRSTSDVLIVACDEWWLSRKRIVRERGATDGHRETMAFTDNHR